MMEIDLRDITYLQRIVEHCERIEETRKRFGDDYEIFSKDADYSDAVNMNIFQIGELTNHVSDGTKEKLGDIPWAQMYGIRNILAHAYVKVDDQLVWKTVIKDIPSLKQRLHEIL